MAAKIFISYRRDDSAGYAGRVHDQLVEKLGSNVFMDVDGIPLGSNLLPSDLQELSLRNGINIRHDSFFAATWTDWSEGSRRNYVEAIGATHSLRGGVRGRIGSIPVG